ncbi:unnamed protein product, partial [Allacma fusca]
MSIQRLFCRKNARLYELLKLSFPVVSYVNTSNSRSPSALYPRVKYEWPYSSDFRKPSLLWKLKSTITCFAVGLWGKSVLCLLNTTKFNNLSVLTDAIFRRPPGVPLVTLANHESCVDDPCLIGAVMTNG